MDTTVFLDDLNVVKREGVDVPGSYFNILTTGYVSIYTPAAKGFDGYIKSKFALQETGFKSILLQKKYDRNTWQDGHKGANVGEYHLRDDLTIWYFPYLNDNKIGTLRAVGIIGNEAKDVINGWLRFPNLISQEFKEILERAIKFL